jgi:hypothetical protein
VLRLWRSRLIWIGTLRYTLAREARGIHRSYIQVRDEVSVGLVFVDEVRIVMLWPC